MDPWMESFARANFVRSSDTAHDLKTPLNVAVLNLELLRMRIRKVAGDDDEKVLAYTRSIETELRRMARIFDTFFVLSTPPKNEGDPTEVDLCPLCTTAAADAGYTLTLDGPIRTLGHESRIRQALKFFFEGSGRVLKADERRVESDRNGGFSVLIHGTPTTDDFELTKVFKFYYTDPEGNPDISLAAARLIAETYGGDLSASQDHDKVTFRMTFPLGDK